MSQPGIGAMLHAIGGGSPKSASDYYGRRIKAAEMKDDSLFLTFDDGVKIKIWDDGQSCCEHRYITTDDDIQSLVGFTLKHVAVKPGPDTPGEYSEHEVCFVEIMTDDFFITLVNHNEHNGYYGGFGLSLDEVTA